MLFLWISVKILFSWVTWVSSFTLHPLLLSCHAFVIKWDSYVTVCTPFWLLLVGFFFFYLAYINAHSSWSAILVLYDNSLFPFFFFKNRSKLLKWANPRDEGEKAHQLFTSTHSTALPSCSSSDAGILCPNELSLLPGPAWTSSLASSSWCCRKAQGRLLVGQWGGGGDSMRISKQCSGNEEAPYSFPEPHTYIRSKSCAKCSNDLT